MKDDTNKEILRRLDTIVYLLLELKDSEGKMALKDKIKLLSDTGLNYTQIAESLGKSPGSVAVQLSNMKKKQTSNEKKEVPENEQ